MAVTTAIVISRHSLPKKMNLPGQTAGSNAPLVKSRGDEGSLSVLIMGLFLITIALLLLMSDVSSIALSKRTLTQATEAAALRAVQSLDKAAYYQGTSAVGVPLDCSMARIRVLEELDLWMSKDEMHRPELSEIRLTDFYCEGNTVDLRTWHYLFVYRSRHWKALISLLRQGLARISQSGHSLAKRLG